MTIGLTRIIVFTAILSLVMVSPVIADTVSAKGEIVSIDAAKRQISVKRKTSKGEKTGDFLVSKKASISIGGELAGFDELEVGQTVSLTFDTQSNEVVSVKLNPQNSKPMPVHIELTGHNGIVFALAFTPDGNHLVSAGSDRTVRVWDVSKNQPPVSHVTLRHPVAKGAGVIGLAVQKGGSLVASCGNDGSIRLWDFADASRPTMKGEAQHRTDIISIAISSDGKFLYSASRTDGSIKIWSINDKGLTEQKHKDGEVKAIWSLALSQDGSLLLLGLGQIPSDGNQADKRAISGELWLFKLEDSSLNRRQVIRGLKSTEPARALAFSSSGKFFTCSDSGTVNVYDSSSRKIVATYEGHDPRQPVLSCRFMPDEKRIVSAGYDQTIRIWEIESSEEVFSFTDSKKLESCDVSSDGRSVACVGHSGTIHFFRLQEKDHREENPTK